VQQQAAHRISRAATVVLQVHVVRVAVYRHVLPEGGEQIAEGRQRQLVAKDCRRQFGERRFGWRQSLGDCIDGALVSAQRCQSQGGGDIALVGEIVRVARELVDGEHSRAERSWQEH
jgi:hypothetical protein